MNAKEIKEGDKISFSVVRSGILGDSFSDMLVDTVASYDVARYLDNNLNIKHKNLFPFFKEKVDNIDNPANYKYLILKSDITVSTPIVIGLPWIEDSSLKLSVTRKAVIEMANFEEYKRASLETFLNNAGIKYVLTYIEE